MSLPHLASSPHGTRARYTTGCRCDTCRAANTAAYHARRQQMREQRVDVVPSGPPIEGVRRRGKHTLRSLFCPGANGAACVRGGGWLKGRDVCFACVERATVWNGLVPADRTRQHLLDLSAVGVGYKSVSAASDVSKTVLFRVMAGTKVRVRASIERRVLAVDADAAADGATVDGARVREIVAALRARGFRLADIARALDIDETAVSSQARRDRVLVSTIAVYERLLRRVERGDFVSSARIVDAKDERAFLVDLVERGVPLDFLSARLGFGVSVRERDRSRLMNRKNRDAVRAFRAELEEMRREGVENPEGWETEGSGALGTIAAAFGFAKEGGNRGWGVGGLSRGEPVAKKRRRKKRKSAKLTREQALAQQREKMRAKRAAMDPEARRARDREHQRAKRARDRAAAEYAEAAE